MTTAAPPARAAPCSAPHWPWPPAAGTCSPAPPEPSAPPLPGNWQHLATTNPARIHRWWARAPFNIGISCGPSHLVIIDLDVPKDADDRSGAAPADGAASLANLCHRHSKPCPPAMFTVDTPSGGRHLYFRATGRQVRNSAGRLGPFIDIRADGGYVIGPGSKIGGRAYELVTSGWPAPLPAWIADVLNEHPDLPAEPRELPAPGTHNATAYAMAALRSECHRMVLAVDGTRHDTLNKAARSPASDHVMPESSSPEYADPSGWPAHTPGPAPAR